MAWSNPKVTLDPDKPTVGFVSVTWDAGGPNEFVYARRAAISGASAQEFKSDAIAARDAFLTRRASEQTLQTQLLTLMNAP